MNFSEHHITLTVVAAGASYAGTHIAKPFIKSFVKDKQKSASLVRLVAVIIGGAVGWTLTYKIVDLWLGVSAGAFNALLVKKIKSKVKDDDVRKDQKP